MKTACSTIGIGKCIRCSPTAGSPVCDICETGYYSLNCSLRKCLQTLELNNIKWNQTNTRVKNNE